jgi:hypothetical protein
MAMIMVGFDLGQVDGHKFHASSRDTSKGIQAIWTNIHLHNEGSVDTLGMNLTSNGAVALMSPATYQGGFGLRRRFKEGFFLVRISVGRGG